MTQPAYNHDAHVRLYYDQRLKDNSKFWCERRAVLAAYERSMEGFIHDDFGHVNEGGYYCRVLFDECPFIVCFREDEQGFVTEVTPRDYEAIWAHYIETQEHGADY
jgi:hypothetical protein